MSNRQQILEAQKRAKEDAEKAERELAAQWEASFNAELDDIYAMCEALAKEKDMPARLFIEQYLLNRKKPAAKAALKSPTELPKYVDPKGAGKPWSGKGPKPEWLQRCLANGYELESLREGSTPKKAGQSPTQSNGVTPSAPTAH